MLAKVEEVTGIEITGYRRKVNLNSNYKFTYAFQAQNKLYGSRENVYRPQRNRPSECEITGAHFRSQQSPGSQPPTART
jgi:hypothetical protein